jgi:hypothetical protein
MNIFKIFLIILNILAFLSALNWYFDQHNKNKLVLDIIIAIFVVMLVITIFI